MNKVVVMSGLGGQVKQNLKMKIKVSEKFSQRKNMNMKNKKITERSSIKLAQAGTKRKETEKKRRVEKS